tara:strand:- start:87 stop:410 length:324 start_codon:yes stop_codon:yes gene_type:complete
MKIIDIDTAKQYIYKTKGKIFSAVFTKKNGEKRRMVCKLGVKKYVKGVGMKYNPRELGYITVYDMHKARLEDPRRAYRNINTDTLEQIKIKGVEYKIKQKGESNNDI